MRNIEPPPPYRSEMTGWYILDYAHSEVNLQIMQGQR